MKNVDKNIDIKSITAQNIRNIIYIHYF